MKHVFFPLHKAAKMDELRCDCGELTYVPKRYHAHKFTCSHCYGKRS